MYALNWDHTHQSILTETCNRGPCSQGSLCPLKQVSVKEHSKAHDVYPLRCHSFVFLHIIIESNNEHWWKEGN